jgi:hypothetical protein
MGLKVSREEFDRLMGREPVEGSPKAGRGKKPRKMPSYMKPAPGVMNDTEEAFAREVLDAKIREGELCRYDFELINLKLGDKLHYRPDFLVLRADGEFVFFEVKGGRVEEDAMVKVKAAANLFPFRFFLAKTLPKAEAAAAGGRWDIREITGSGGWKP